MRDAIVFKLADPSAILAAKTLFNCILKQIASKVFENYSQTKWSVPLKIALMNWLFETWTR